MSINSTDIIRRQAEEQLHQAEQARMANISAGTRRQLLHLLYAREAKSLACVDVLHAQPVRQEKDTGRLLLLIAAIVLSLGSFALWLTLPQTISSENSGWVGRFVLCAAVQLLSLGVSGVCAAVMLRRQPEVTVTAEENDIHRLVLEADSRIALDAQTIEVLFTQDSMASVNVSEDTACEIYAALYEMMQDARLSGSRQQENALSWPLSNAQSLLNSMGCQTVDYAPDKAAYFDVMDSDIDQQRYPAIVAKESGLMLRRGLMLQSHGKGGTR